MDKEIQSEMMTDSYNVYKETEDLYIFMKKMIHKLLMFSCAVTDNYYTLAKINFFKDFNDDNQLAQLTDKFNMMIDFKMNGSFNFNDFINTELIPIDPDTNEIFDINKFIKFLKKKYKIVIELDKDGCCDYKYLSNIILNLDKDITNKIIYFKKIYELSFEILIKSQQELFYFIEELGKKKHKIPNFLLFLFLNHLPNYIDDGVLEKIKNIL